MKNLTLLLVTLLTFGSATAQCSIFSDDFETGIVGPAWQNGGGTYTTVTTTTNPAEGTYALENTGSSGFYQGAYTTFVPSQPDSLSFWMKTNNTAAANGYVVIGDANTQTNNGILFCYFNSGGSLRFFNSSGTNFPVNANQWYHIEVKDIDWTAKHMDIYMDGALILQDWAFRTPASTEMTQIQLFNLTQATATYDNIIIGSTGPSSNINTTICASDSVVVNGTTYNAANPSGTEVLVGAGVSGCDSTININLNVLQPLSSAITTTLCANDSIVVNGTTYNAANPTGTEFFAGAGTNGCDSTVTINLTILSELSSNMTNAICAEDSLVVNGTTYNASNPNGIEIFTGSNGCDSTVNVNLTILPAINETIASTLCEGESILVNGTNYDAANPTGMEVMTSVNGCDSTVNIALSFTTINTSVTTAGITMTSDETGATYQWIDCNTNASISGATSQSYTATANGNYAVVITNNNCSDTSSCVSIATVNVNELVQCNIQLVPNPNEGIFTLHMDNADAIDQIDVRDISGRLVHSSDKISNETQVDISNEEAGVYIVAIHTKDGIISKKVVKK